MDVRWSNLGFRENENENNRFTCNSRRSTNRKRLIGYVCGCKSCRTAFPDEKYDHSRPIGLLTHPDEKYGNVRVYTDTMELVN